MLNNQMSLDQPEFKFLNFNFSKFRLASVWIGVFTKTRLLQACLLSLKVESVRERRLTKFIASYTIYNAFCQFIEVLKYLFAEL